MRDRPSEGFVSLHDFAALKSVYEKGEIWATNSLYLNDISEMHLGPKAIMGVLIGVPLSSAQAPLSRFKPIIERLQAIDESTSSGDEEGQKRLKAEIVAALPSIAEGLEKVMEPFRGIDTEVAKEIGAAFEYAMTEHHLFRLQPIERT
jgi:hypothetical protein